MCAESGVLLRPEGHTVARIRAPDAEISPQAVVIPNGFIVRNLLPLAALLLSHSESSRCGNHLEILWEAMIDGIYTALYVCKVSRTVGFALVARLPGLNSHRLGGPRFGL